MDYARVLDDSNKVAGTSPPPWDLPSLQVQIRKRQVPGSGRHTSARPDGVAMPPVLQDMAPQKSLPWFAVTISKNSENSLRTE